VRTTRYTLRPTTLADVESVNALLREVAFKPRSKAGWRWLFLDNPASRRQASPPAMGWVLERGGALHGYVGNVHLDYVLDGKPVRAATCTSDYVRPGARAESTRLMSAFFRQRGVDIFLNTTANEFSEPIYRLFKAAAPADSSFSEGLVWVANDRIALRDTFAHAGLPRALAGFLAAACAPASLLVRSLTGFAKPPRHTSTDAVLEFRPDQIDARFDRLWEQVAAAPGLRVRRDAARLRWYLSDPDAGSVPVIFALADEEGLLGYAAAARHRSATAPRTQMRIIDLVVRPGAARAVPVLLQRVLAHARDTGAGLVFCAPGGASLATELKTLRPYRLRHSYASHLLRASQGSDTARLAAPGVWEATALDGDAPFCIENAGIGALVSASRQPG